MIGHLGHAWEGACMVGACITGHLGHAWEGACTVGAWRACMAGGMQWHGVVDGTGVCVAGDLYGRGHGWYGA